MRGIKNGKIYDTEQSEQIARYSNGGSTQDFSHVRETLYKTNNGRYFIAGKGGPKTRYAKSQPNGVSGGSEIRPVDLEKALDWAEDRGVTQQVINEFEEELEEA
jgi:hypothetical protein